MEKLYSLVQFEKDAESREICNFIYNILKKFISDQVATPYFESPFGVPPFEQPTIVEIVEKFVKWKLGSCSESARSSFADLMVSYVDKFVMKSPTDYYRSVENIDPKSMEFYRVAAFRWMVFCGLPFFLNDSPLPWKRTSLAFGGRFLKAVSDEFREKIKIKCYANSGEEFLIRQMLPDFFDALFNELNNPGSFLWKQGESIDWIEETPDDEDEALVSANFEIALRNDHVIRFSSSKRCFSRIRESPESAKKMKLDENTTTVKKSGLRLEGIFPTADEECVENVPPKVADNADKMPKLTVTTEVIRNFRTSSGVRNFDRIALNEELQRGFIEFDLIEVRQNDAHDARYSQKVLRLLKLQDIFYSHGLHPSVSYIITALYHQNLSNLVLLKNGEVIGGICYRTFTELGYAKIWFSAIDADNRVQRQQVDNNDYHAYLMVCLKNLHKRMGVYFLVVYVKNVFELEYFARHGFSTNIASLVSKVKEKIQMLRKFAEKSTVMCCELRAEPFCEK